MKIRVYDLLFFLLALGLIGGWACAQQDHKGEQTMTSEGTQWQDISTQELTPAERQAVAVAEQIPEVKQLRQEHGEALRTGIETLPQVYRVNYRSGDIFLYGVDVDKATGQVVGHGTLD
ncbi:MAG: hypothetical protein ACLFUU_12290 [Desulfobacteraceae bacterium]